MRKRNAKDSFRSTAQWQHKAEEIKARDNYLCQICIRDLYNTTYRVKSDRLSVHHAIPLQIDYSKRLDNDNLITLCDKHHEMAENGAIPYEVVRGIIDEQECGVSPAVWKGHKK